MPRKVIIVGDPGIDGAFAISLALRDPELELIGLAATAGNVPADQATRNVQILIEQLDPPRWPRLGAALPIDYGMDAVKLHGTGGLGGVDFPCAQLHHPHPSDKLISDLVHLHPKEVSIVLMGPATVFARALDRDTEMATLIERLIVVGGAWHEPGDASSRRRVSLLLRSARRAPGAALRSADHPLAAGRDAQTLVLAHGIAANTSVGVADHKLSAANRAPRHRGHSEPLRGGGFPLAGRTRSHPLDPAWGAARRAWWPPMWRCAAN